VSIVIKMVLTIVNGTISLSVAQSFVARGGTEFAVDNFGEPMLRRFAPMAPESSRKIRLT
jgi:hypothetical protein